MIIQSRFFVVTKIIKKENLEVFPNSAFRLFIYNFRSVKVRLYRVPGIREQAEKKTTPPPPLHIFNLFKHKLRGYGSSFIDKHLDGKHQNLYSQLTIKYFFFHCWRWGPDFSQCLDFKPLGVNFLPFGYSPRRGTIFSSLKWWLFILLPFPHCLIFKLRII